MRSSPHDTSIFNALAAHLLGAGIALLIILNLLIMSLIIIAFIIISYALLWTRFHHPLKLFMPTLATAWMYLNRCILCLSLSKKWDIQGPAEHLNPQGWYLLIANHRSWFDILTLGVVFSQPLPPIRFFMKKELLWQLPLAGICCYYLGYPFVSRHSPQAIKKNPALKGKDLQSTRQAAQQFKKRPTTIMSFVEGTRFTSEKNKKQQSPYQHLLKPKASGIATIIEELSDKLDAVIDTTIYYDAQPAHLWSLLCGQVSKIYVRYQLIPLTEALLKQKDSDREHRTVIQQWLNTLWNQKDQWLESHKQ